jgi:hypothetical protein
MGPYQDFDNENEECAFSVVGKVLGITERGLVKSWIEGHPLLRHHMGAKWIFKSDLRLDVSSSSLSSGIMAMSPVAGTIRLTTMLPDGADQCRRGSTVKSEWDDR